jgi:hypothetical protein
MDLTLVSDREGGQPPRLPDWAPCPQGRQGAAGFALD